MTLKITFPVILFLFTTTAVFPQCTAEIVNFPHGNCEGTDIEMMAIPSTGGSGNTYQWTGPENFTSHSQSIYISYAPASYSGIYTVTITDINGCTSTDFFEIIKNPKPLVYTSGQPGGCLGTVTYINAQDISGINGPYSYLWDGGQTTQSLAITHGGGTYPAPACLITNGFGCSAMNNTTFLIYTLPSPGTPLVEALSATSFCKGASVTLVTNMDSSLTYQWRRYALDITGSTGNTYTADKTGNYRVTVTNGFGCTALSNYISVTAFSLPAATITVTGNANICNGDSVLLQANTGSNYSYQWTRYKVNINGASASSYSAKTKGNYRVVVTNQYGCSKTSSLKTITANCREADETIATGEMNVIIYPNPSKDFFTVEWNESSVDNASQILVSDLTGRIIETRSITEGAGNMELGSNWNAGIYFIEMIDGDKKISKKIIKTQ